MLLMIKILLVLLSELLCLCCNVENVAMVDNTTAATADDIVGLVVVCGDGGGVVFPGIHDLKSIC